MSPYYYIPEQDLYISNTGDVYTDEQLDEFDRMEHEWRNSLPRYSFSQLMEIFPEAIRPARKGLKEKLKQYKQVIKNINERQEEYYDNVICKAHFTEQAEIKAESDIEFDEMKKVWSSRIRSTMFNLSFLDEFEGKEVAKKTGGINELDIAKAKEIPITNFYNDKLHTHGKIAIGCCPFHNEKTASFTIYLDQNSFWCYGCQTGGSVVDFVMQRNRVDFLTAVKQILK